MPRSSIGQAKNSVRRALRAVIDREPKERDIDKLWNYFVSSCAYCGLQLIRSDRKGHLDHLVHDGPNHISNRVLSCSVCNGDEKRDQQWEKFLEWKTANPELFAKRKARIEEWVRGNLNIVPKINAQEMVEREITGVMEAIDSAAKRLRDHRDSTQK